MVGVRVIVSLLSVPWPGTQGWGYTSKSLICWMFTEWSYVVSGERKGWSFSQCRSTYICFGWDERRLIVSRWYSGWDERVGWLIVSRMLRCRDLGMKRKGETWLFPESRGTGILRWDEREGRFYNVKVQAFWGERWERGLIVSRVSRYTDILGRDERQSWSSPECRVTDISGWDELSCIDVFTACTAEAL